MTGRPSTFMSRLERLGDIGDLEQNPSDLLGSSISMPLASWAAPTTVAYRARLKAPF